MKNKNIAIISLLAIFFAILVLPVMSTATAITAPLEFDNDTGTLWLNVTTALADATNVTCWYNASGGAVNGSDIFVLINNITADQTEFNSSVTISGYEDGLNYSIMCQANSTVSSTDENSSVTSSLTFDSTVPICTLTGDHITIPYKGNILLSWTSSDALSLISTLVTIDGPQDQTTISDTDTNEDRTLTSQDTKYIGDWVVSIGARDRASNVCNTTYTFESYLPNGDIWEAGEPVAATKDRGLITLGIIALGLIAWFAFGKRK